MLLVLCICLKRIDFDAIVDHLALTHIIKSKTELTTTRIKRLFEILSSYSFSFFHIKGKTWYLMIYYLDKNIMIANPHEIIPISFKMQSILPSKYYNIGKGKIRKYLVQTRSQAKSSGICVPEVHGIGKGQDLNILPEKKVVKPIITSEVKRIPQSKPRLGQGRAVLR